MKSDSVSAGEARSARAFEAARRHSRLVRILRTALIFGAAGALGPALQAVGITQGYYLFYAAPYVLTLGIMISTCSSHRAFVGAPGELSVTK